MRLLDYLTIFQENKNIIIEYWLSSDSVINILISKNIEKDFFKKEYANFIFDNYIKVIEDSSNIGKCPIMEQLLKYFKYFNFSTSELFQICSSFKLAITRLTYDKQINSFELDKELDNIFELNFSNILSKYTQTVNEVEDKLIKTLSIINKYIIMSKTDKEGIITEVSEGFCDITGYKKEEVIGKSHNIIRHNEMNNLVFKQLWQTILSGKVWKGEIKNKKKDGTTYWIYATIEPIFDKVHNIIGFYAISQDITSKKEFEEQQNMLIEQSKSAAMGEMISMIAHQWRQPLQAVSILVQKLPLVKMIDGEITDQAINQVVDDVGIQLEYMSKTIDDFRDFFKPNKEKEIVRISSLINKTLDFLSYMLKVDVINFNKKIEDDVVIKVHINEIVQVLINIIKNARDVMIEKNILHRLINIHCYKQNDFLIIEIEDNAGGIPENIISKVFEPYFSTKEKKNGTGIGLYMSKTIIEQHSLGKLSVFNSDLGAVFKIELPLI
ncbi:hypothetical protein CPU12_06960 [Malaciobacter molluscorum LMG 25693]|uniref:histidine kinase n=1 Tax=Malaciobacter molluscorum LMG 25693 TaxID=870501 RepID=A0A2G1DI62_9BACT|nr:PAS domain-containing sensor histidine kinase [Malaciobacter molluscorum]AXX92351.1 PAS sensor-containing two-component system histidine kinase [Malaciobacter molluscorum LMG 25693]PHO18198.1 hypothetical protein CPU12_06960 [Malaciobacter molluscorum LMG 25693]RXJ93987.1 hypothetical protein CRV00_08905 [Malaciobacter molluscorum]